MNKNRVTIVALIVIIIALLAYIALNKVQSNQNGIQPAYPSLFQKIKYNLTPAPSLPSSFTMNYSGSAGNSGSNFIFKGQVIFANNVIVSGTETSTYGSGEECTITNGQWVDSLTGGQCEVSIAYIYDQLPDGTIEAGGGAFPTTISGIENLIKKNQLEQKPSAECWNDHTCYQINAN